MNILIKLVITAFPTNVDYLAKFDLLWRSPVTNKVAKSSIRIVSEDTAARRGYSALTANQIQRTTVSIPKTTKKINRTINTLPEAAKINNETEAMVKEVEDFREVTIKEVNLQK